MPTNTGKRKKVLGGRSSASLDLTALASSLERISKGAASGGLGTFLHQHKSSLLLGATQLVFHCHVINLNGNGQVRLADLINHLTDSLLDYAIPRSSIAAAAAHRDATGSTRKLMELAREARDLFTSLKKSGEGGELLLYLLAEEVLKLPQLLCKMDLKTSSNVHFHGADGLHVGIGASGKLALYWGESKVYKTFSGALSACYDSLAPILLDPVASENRDLQLLSRHMDLNDAALEEALKDFLLPSSPSFNKLEYRGVCLVGFDVDKYPTNPNCLTIADVCSGLDAHLPGWQASIQRGATSAGIDSFAIHMFCLPVPSADAFRKSFRHALRVI